MSKDIMKVVIIGSGLVGAATAIALRKAGHECTLYDQVNLAEAAAKATGGIVAVDFGDSGGSVMLRSNALRVIRDLGLLHEVMANSSPNILTHFQKIDGSAPIVHKTMEEVARIEPEKDLQAPRQIMRSKLHSIFVTAAHKAGVKTIVGKKAIRVEETTDRGVNIRFVDGSGVYGDLVVGADGIHSVTRRQIFGEETKPKFTGVIGYIGVVDLQVNNIALDQTCSFFVDRMKKHLVSTFKVSEKLAAIQVMVFGDPDPEEEEGYRPYSDLPKHSARLGDLIESWGVPKNIAEMMRKSFRISPASIYDLPDLTAYHKGHVVLLGDSAHGMVPNAGLGLGAGIEDVGVFFELLQKYPDEKDLDTVLRLYSAIRVPSATFQSNNSRTLAEQFYSTTFGSSGGQFLLRLFINAINYNLYQPIKEVYDCKKVVERAIAKEKNEAQ
ncbi:hypothetical protein HK100_007876 [Physocladia obscura]|uniref:FAD-binding domain-containing protein n=1 Tax=Physocladia obscura TaxID=109957 RepID=A0AAD5T520_9FUNG|nr:hypothetical protein HK100_007876 [Physocladia obscura]